MDSPDRDYFARIGTAKALSEALSRREYEAMSLVERLALGVRISKMALRLGSPAPHDDPSPFYDRARALGLYRP